MKQQIIYDKIKIPDNSYIFSCGKNETGGVTLYGGRQHILVAVPSTYTKDSQITINDKQPNTISILNGGFNNTPLILNNYVFYSILNVTPNPRNIQFSTFDDIFHVSVHPLYFINFTKEFKIHSITKIIKINHQFDIEYNTVQLYDFFDSDYKLNTIKTHQHGYYKDIVNKSNSNELFVFSSRRIDAIYGEKLYLYCINKVLGIDDNCTYDLDYYYRKYNDIKQLMKTISYEDLTHELKTISDSLSQKEIIPQLITK